MQDRTTVFPAPPGDLRTLSLPPLPSVCSLSALKYPLVRANLSLSWLSHFSTSYIVFCRYHIFDQLQIHLRLSTCQRTERLPGRFSWVCLLMAPHCFTLCSFRCLNCSLPFPSTFIFPVLSYQWRLDGGGVHSAFLVSLIWFTTGYRIGKWYIFPECL